MYKILIVAFFLLSCQDHLTEKTISKADDNMHYYFVRSYNDSAEEYFEYLGEMNILAKRYKVFNFFKRVKAAELWHGKSRLVFFTGEDTTSYILDSNQDFPGGIINNELDFYQKKTSFHIDSLSNVLCLPTGCIEKEEPSHFISYFNIDSVKKVFRGGYPPDYR